MIRKVLHLVSKLAQHNGINSTALPNMEVYCFADVPTPPLYSTYPLSLTLTVQGRKRLLYGKQILEYGAGEAVLITMDLPLSAQIIQAEPLQPYLCVHIGLDAAQLAQTAAQQTFTAPLPRHLAPALTVFTVNDVLLDAVYRLLRVCTEEQHLVPQLAPLIQQEITVRLLHHPVAQTPLRLLLSGSRPTHKIARALTRIRQNATHKIAIDSLASELNMSPTAFRQHFRLLTGFSPLQYQKQLRLQQARHLLHNQKITAAEAAERVGYASVSQFSREYRRLFDETPSAKKAA
ncbi:MAG: AraC family transcriptional regulator [Conchiformibius sp.]|nr:AraC family transcriptional regulator [Conchiformibius sp.]